MMKKNLLLFILLLLTINTFAQLKKTIICGRVKSDDKFIIRIFAPVNGFNNVFLIDTGKVNREIVDSKDSIYTTIKIDRPSFVNIRFETENRVFINRTDILLFPGDSVNIQFDLSVGNSNWAQYGGDNALGQKLFNEINYSPGDKFVKFYSILNQLPLNRNTLVSDINNAVADVKKQFADLSNKGQISNLFVDAMGICFEELYYHELIDKFIRNFQQREVISKATRDSILTQITSILPANDSRLFGLYNYPLYLTSYYDFQTYKKFQLKNIEDILKEKKITVDGNEYLIDGNLMHAALVNDKKIGQDMWAFDLLMVFRLFPGTFDNSNIVQYCKLFPDNQWESLLLKQFAAYQPPPKVGYKLQFPIVYIDSSKNIVTFQSLLKKLPPGKAVFVDCWASWCVPCVEAFAYNNRLDSLLKANNIVRLYISIDNRSNYNKWKDLVGKYCLGGYNILVNDNLLKDVRSICKISPEKGFEIPRYMFINSNGIVWYNDIASPENFEQLKNQLLKYNSVLVPIRNN